MTCLDENKIDAFVRGRLDDDARAEVDRHVAACSTCRVLISSVMQSDAAKTVVDPPAAADTLENVGGGSHPAEGERLFAIGERLADRWRVVRFVAEGGMGEVYEAEDLELARRVALKTVRSDIAGDPGALERFRREIALAHEVSHPNVCRIYDLGFHQRHERITFLTMEFLAGDTLMDRLRERGAMTVDEALPIVRQMAAGLAAAHAAGVVHRDFKSPNVMIVDGPKGPRAVVTDFGLARSEGTGDATRSDERSLVGSPAYMAPEQVEGRRVDARADQYAFGVVLFEMMTGAFPFVGDTPMRTAMMRLTEDPPAPRTLRPELDPRWNRVILRCLSRDPSRRYASVLDAVRELEAGPATASVAKARVAFTIGLVGALAAAAAVLWPKAPAPSVIVVPPVERPAPIVVAAPYDAAVPPPAPSKKRKTAPRSDVLIEDYPE